MKQNTKDEAPPAKRPTGRPRKHAAPGSAALPALSREIILDRAYELARSERLEEISIERLAREFGVSSTTVRHHLVSREALTLALVNRYFREHSRSLPPLTGDWEVDLYQFSASLMKVSLARPGLTEYLLNHRFSGIGATIDERDDCALSVYRQGLSILQAAGFEPMELALYWHLLILLILSIAHAESSRMTPLQSREVFESFAKSSAANEYRTLLPSLKALARIDVDLLLRTSVSLICTAARVRLPLPAGGAIKKAARK